MDPVLNLIGFLSVFFVRQGRQMVDTDVVHGDSPRCWDRLGFRAKLVGLHSDAFPAGLCRHLHLHHNIHYR